MIHIRKYKTFESFSIKGPLGKRMVYCHDCGHSFQYPKAQPRKIICPACAAMGLLSRGMAYLKPIERKF